MKIEHDGFESQGIPGRMITRPARLAEQSRPQVRRADPSGVPTERAGPVALSRQVRPGLAAGGSV
jgi:hypothetical protein